MRIALKEFQEDAVNALMKHLRYARNEVRSGDPQAIILSSPTGSGKTVTVTALLENVLRGDETYAPDDKAVFLWLSDSPELNVQSREKILSQSSVFNETDLIIVEPPFSIEKFESGKIYFLNTQKLGKDTILTKTGDGRDFTIWQTIENTTQSIPDHFYVVIDEAHRGMNLSARDVKKAQSIIQKFIFGDPFEGLSPVKIVIGLSATPERFAKIIERSTRIKREYNIPPSAVRDSGLLKDRIILYCPDDDQPSDWTLLSESVKRWKQFGEIWKKYCKDQGIDLVDPILVIQVEDKVEGKITKTDLAQVLRIIEREAGSLESGEIAHAFEDPGPIQAESYVIRKIDPSKIEHDPIVKVVFFKMALTTGWDCPRAEVMMSFRKAQDHTLIAQLVGRMVRTPLARRIEGHDLLNSVSLYLPHYNRTGLQAIVERLNDPEYSSPTEIVEGSRLVTLTRNPSHKNLFSLLERIPSYDVERIPKTTNVRRLIKLSRQLTFDEINPNAWDDAKNLIITTLSRELETKRSDPEFVERYKANQTIDIQEVQIEAGEWREVDSGRIITVTTTPENIDNLFDTCGRTLGEGLHKEFWKANWDRDDPQRVKLELFGLLQNKEIQSLIENTALRSIESLLERYKDTIRELRSSKREEYNRIRRRAKEPQTISLFFPDSFETTKEEPLWNNHLYINDSNKFGWAANTWERSVLKSEMDSGKLVAWLRNFPRKQWSLCIPYRYRGEDKPCYPDLIVFRNDGNKMKLDLLDPHDPGLPDAVDKAVGLARYAKKHGDFFGRIELIIVGRNDEIKRLDVNKEEIQEQVLKVEHPSHLEALFEINQ